VNNLTVCPGCEAGIGRADIEESKSNVAMNAWLPQASYPCGNFSDTSCVKVGPHKRIVRPHFHGLHWYWECKSSELLPLCSKWDFCSHGVHLGTPVLSFNRCAAPAKLPNCNCHQQKSNIQKGQLPSRMNSINDWATFLNWLSETTSRVVVFHSCTKYSHLFYTSQVISQLQTRVKLNRVFFPRYFPQARSLGCGFAG
jgi:hypothetical protein